MNPLMNLINGTSATPGTTVVGNSKISEYQQVADQVKPILQQIQSAKNPAELMQRFCMQNPAFKERFEFAKSVAGMNPKEAFYARARQCGIDPDAFISALRK